MATLGRKLAGARIEAGLTQRELGEACGVTGEAVRQWESDRTRPGVARLKRAADKLGRPVTYFLEDGPATEAPEPTGDLATEARLLRQRLEALESASRAASPGAPGLPVQELQSRGIELSPQELQWLREYGGAPCDSLAKLVDLVLLWRGWELRDRLKD